jgi:hypothetical protein
MVRRLPHFRIAHAQNQNSGILIVDATDITACRRPLPRPPAHYRFSWRRYRRHACRNGAAK